MSPILPATFDPTSPNAAFAERSRRHAATGRAMAVFRAAVPWSSWPPLVLIALCYHLLLTLTGNGPRSWEARLCAGDAAGVEGCRAIRARGGQAGAEAAL